MEMLSHRPNQVQSGLGPGPVDPRFFLLLGCASSQGLGKTGLCAAADEDSEDLKQKLKVSWGGHPVVDTTGDSFTQMMQFDSIEPGFRK